MTLESMTVFATCGYLRRWGEQYAERPQKMLFWGCRLNGGASYGSRLRR